MKGIVHIAQHVEGMLGAQVPHRAGDELDIVARTLIHNFIDFGIVQAMHLRGRAVAQVDGIRIGDQVAHLLPGQVIDNMPPYLFGQGEFAVGKRAGARPAAHNIAGVAVDAVMQLARGAGAAVDVQARINQQQLGFGHFLRQFQGSEDARRPCADDNDIIDVRHGKPPSRHDKTPFPAHGGGDGPECSSQKRPFSK